MNTNKFLFNSGAMLSALQTIGKVMERRPVVPILENYLFTVKDGILTVSGTDLQNTFRLSFPIESDIPLDFRIPDGCLIRPITNDS